MENKYLGYLSLADTPKPDAVQAIRELKDLKLIIFKYYRETNRQLFLILAEKIGVTQAFGDLLPEGKVAHLEQLKANSENRVAFVGDGINDTPVLALSDVGIAMGGLGM